MYLCADPGVAYIGWRPVKDDGKQEWVQMRSGAGESGWWHRHPDAPEDFGSNPVDCGRYGVCRSCHKSAAPLCRGRRRRIVVMNTDHGPHHVDQCIACGMLEPDLHPELHIRKSAKRCV